MATSPVARLVLQETVRRARAVPDALKYYHESELLAEVQRREELRRRGLCDFCYKRHTDKVCLMTERHKGRQE